MLDVDAAHQTAVQIEGQWRSCLDRQLKGDHSVNSVSVPHDKGRCEDLDQRQDKSVDHVRQHEIPHGTGTEKKNFNFITESIHIRALGERRWNSLPIRFSQASKFFLYVIENMSKNTSIRTALSGLTEKSFRW